MDTHPFSDRLVDTHPIARRWGTVRPHLPKAMGVLRCQPFPARLPGNYSRKGNRKPSSSCILLEAQRNLLLTSKISAQERRSHGFRPAGLTPVVFFRRSRRCGLSGAPSARNPWPCAESDEAEANISKKSNSLQTNTGQPRKLSEALPHALIFRRVFLPASPPRSV